jgi:FMN reductase
MIVTRLFTSNGQQAPLSIVAINGSPYLPSRTSVLLQHLSTSLVTALQRTRPVDIRIIEFADIAVDVGSALSRPSLSAKAEDALQAVEGADVLIVGSPVFRGSLPGLFKHFFDLVHIDALIDTPVLFAVTGGSDRHALVIDHQFRPLFSFFQSLTLPIGVYASQADFSDYRIASEALQARIELAVERALPVLQTLQPAKSPAHAATAAVTPAAVLTPAASAAEPPAATQHSRHVLEKVA